MHYVTVDAHCDTILKLGKNRGLFDLSAENGQLDIKRLINHVDVQFFAVFINVREHKALLSACLKYIQSFLKEIEVNRELIKLVRNRDDLSGIGSGGKINAILSVEGGDVLEGKLTNLDLLFELGVRSLGLTWNGRNELADGCLAEPNIQGLTPFGRQVVQKMNEKGMLVDVSHLSERGFWSVLDISNAPVIASHSNCRALCNHVRNLTDHQIRALADHHGVMGVAFVPDFLTDQPAHIDHVVDHIEHIASLVGVNHVGLGSDFDGTDHLPVGLEDVTGVSQIAEKLKQRGYTNSDIGKIMGGNFLRVLQEVLPVC